MAKFSKEHMTEMSSGKYFSEGIHKVKIAGVTFDKTDGGKEFAEFTVVSDDGQQEDTARVWFTTDKAMQYALTVIRGIFVHNTPEKDKEKTREKFDAIEDTEQLEKACQNLIGKEAWFTTYKDHTRMYTAKDGTQKPSFQRNIYGYEPKPQVIQQEPVAQSAEDLKMPAGSDDEQPFGF